MMLVAALLLAACGGGGGSSGHRSSGFPRTPAGLQASWLLGAVAHVPIPAAAIHAHYDTTFLALVPPSQLNNALQGVGEPRLLSIATNDADRLVFLVAIKGGRRFQVTLGVDARGLINGLLFSAPSVAPSGGDVPAPAAGWVAQAVTFAAGRMTIYGTYTHPRAAAARVPGALLIQGSGNTDRNDNEPGFVVNTLAAAANWLSQDGVATLRYDKLASGETGAGPYAAHPDSVGIAPYEQEAAAALRFLARQSQVDPSRLAVVGHSEGGLYALLLATGLAGTVPSVHALVLLESQRLTILDHIHQQITAQVTAQQRAGAVDHVLKEDTSRTSAFYTKPLPFSSQLRAALRAFVVAHL
jgi:dienelactone hydrolase